MTKGKKLYRLVLYATVIYVNIDNSKFLIYNVCPNKTKKIHFYIFITLLSYVHMSHIIYMCVMHVKVLESRQYVNANG